MVIGIRFEQISLFAVRNDEFFSKENESYVDIM